MLTMKFRTLELVSANWLSTNIHESHVLFASMATLNTWTSRNDHYFIIMGFYMGFPDLCQWVEYWANPAGHDCWPVPDGCSSNGRFISSLTVKSRPGLVLIIKVTKIAREYRLSLTFTGSWLCGTIWFVPCMVEPAYFVILFVPVTQSFLSEFLRSQVRLTNLSLRVVITDYDTQTFRHIIYYDYLPYLR